MNILSFDIEEWYIEKMFRAGEQWKYDAYTAMLERLLDLLDSHSTCATFFCLGALAEHFPDVVRRIAARGHEIGCHSLAHKWVNRQTPEEFMADTRKAIDALQNCSGKTVTSYRAPAFSIGKSNIWAFILTAYSEINEFPITMGRLPVIGRKIAYSGGGYFRLLPLGLVHRLIDKSDYVMCYFHVADLVDFKSRMMTREEYNRYFKAEGTLRNRIVRYLKSNVGRKRTFAGLSDLLDRNRFVSVDEAARQSQSFPQIHLE